MTPSPPSGGVFVRPQSTAEEAMRPALGDGQALPARCGAILEERAPAAGGAMRAGAAGMVGVAEAPHGEVVRAAARPLRRLKVVV